MVTGDPRRKLEIGFDIADRMAGLLAKSPQVGSNPRTVKRLMNVVRMRSEIAKRREMPLDEALIAKLALFERCTDSAATATLYGLINRSDAGAPEVIQALEAEEDEASLTEKCADEFDEKHAVFIRDWIRLKPSLGTTDLRPLVYLSRETLPLASIDGALTPAAEKTVRTLLLVKSQSSLGASKALKPLSDEEKAQVMAALIAELRRATVWNTAPHGFQGFLILASETAECGRMARRFIDSLQLKRLPAWMKVAVKDEPWYVTEK